MKHIETHIRDCSSQNILCTTPARRDGIPDIHTPSHSGDARSIIEKEVDLLICMDSNSRYMDFRKLWMLRNSERTQYLNQLSQYIHDSDIKKQNYILINTGLNDIDTKSGIQVFSEIKKTINLIKTKYPNTKIIMCEVTPRDDIRDVHVIECNKLVTRICFP